LSLEWTQLPFQEASSVKKIQALGDEISKKYENVISLGIGGSYLGLKAAQDALCTPYYNEFAGARKKRPRIYFEGNNLDPDTLSVLLKNLNPKKTFVIVISKSGETTETKAALILVVG
jgi:glucose-6-phosphate isomerase